MSKVLIDTNIYSLALRGDSQVVATLRQIHLIGISTISIGELFSGFKGGNREEENRRELAEFLDSPRARLYPIDENTANYYSSILNQLKKDGNPIPTNDIWIAASAFQHGLQLYSFDKHFRHIAGLILL